MTWHKIIRWSLIIVSFIFLIRVFACQTIKLETYEMSSTILPNDRVIVSKLLTGSRLPTTILGLPGADNKYVDKRLPYHRLPAIRKFKRNDIIVFNDPRLTDSPIDRKPLIISRIAGLPGDTINVLDKNLYTNRKVVPAPARVRREYIVVTDGSSISEEFILKYNINTPDVIADIGIYNCLLDTIAYVKLLEQTNVKQVRQQLTRSGDSSSGYWPHSNFYNWNRDQVGPLVVPYKGLSIDITLSNIDQYRDLIENHEGNELLIDFSGISINGSTVESYTFKRDYYFVMDDNRDEPNDSRIFGYVPKNHLLGKIKRKLWSTEIRSILKSLD